MPVHPVPQRTDIAPQFEHRALRALRLLSAALVVMSLASAPMVVRAASILSDPIVTPTSGTTATVFTFSVHYTSTESPQQPAQTVFADVAGTTVQLLKISGSAHDGTWQGTAILPAGTWPVTFNATTSTAPQPAPLAGPIITVTEPPPPPPTPTPAPTPPATPRPTSPPTPRPVPQPTPDPTAADAPSEAPTSPSTSPSGSSSASPSATATPTRTADEKDDPTATPDPTDLAADDAATPGSMFASLLIVGGTMTLAGAAVLARQWYVARGARPH